MTQTLPSRQEADPRFTWDTAYMFATPQDWEREFEAVSAALPSLSAYQGRLSESADTLLRWFEESTGLLARVSRLGIYASMAQSVDSTDQEATARHSRSVGLSARASAVTAFARPELLALPADTLEAFMEQRPELQTYGHYFDDLARQRPHVRSPEVEELLGQLSDPFRSAAGVHPLLANTELRFRPALEHQVAQGNIDHLLQSEDRELRREAWQSYADGHLELKNTMSALLATGVKQNVFRARARGYASSLEAALSPNNLPVEVFHNLIETYRRHLPTWHRYWQVRARALGLPRLAEYDVKAPLSAHPPVVSYDTAVRYIVDGMAPLGPEYVEPMHAGLTGERWVDIYPNTGKRLGAYSTGNRLTKPYIFMSFHDTLFGMSTLAHEVGHSMHSYLTWKTQPAVYSSYSLFVAEVASNFNQALVRAHLFEREQDPDFQIAVIEEAMSNFHRYFFIMPTLARFELELHERVERGQALSADGMIALMADLLREGYGPDFDFDAERSGITWAQFSNHMYANFYTWQYATGIAAANALSEDILSGQQGAVERYLAFLKAGSSLYPLDALRLAGVDLATPEPVEKAFGVLSKLVDRLEALVGAREQA